YYGICHYDNQGNYKNTVDVTKLPTPTTPQEIAARKLSIAKLERMAQRRGDLVHALNATFPDVMIPDITSSNKSAQIRLHDALMTFAQGLTPLYESNPLDATGAPLVPSQTRALSQLFANIGAPGTCSGGGASCSYDADCGAGK